MDTQAAVIATSGVAPSLSLRRAPVPQPDPHRAEPCALIEVRADRPWLRLDLRYAGVDNFLGRAFYPEARMFLHADAARALHRAGAWFARRGLGLHVYDGYRPWSVTREFWDASPPGWRDGYLADPAVGSNHNRGVAVDLTLFSLADGSLLPMPSEFDEFSERAHVSYAGARADQRTNQRLLEEGMREAGFCVLATEWWHFDYGDVARYPVLDAALEEVRAAAEAGASC